MWRFIAIAIVGLAGCSDKHRDGGLPPAKEWGSASGSGGASAPNPHAAMGQDPHAGLNPHAGMGSGSPDVGAMGLPAPDPNRPIDPSRRVKGVISIHAKAASRAKSGGAVFLVVKRADAAGAPTGTPLAVEKLTWTNKELPFELTERQAMIAGTQLSGDVVVTARYDQDSDAISKQPGDIVGQVRVTVPADNVKLVLDQIVP